MKIKRILLTLNNEVMGMQQMFRKPCQIPVVWQSNRHRYKNTIVLLDTFLKENLPRLR